MIIVPCFAQADNDETRAANESSALKMNIISVKLLGTLVTADAIHFFNYLLLSAIGMGVN